MANEWFSCDAEDGSPEELAFVQIIRSRAPELAELGIEPRDTWALLAPNVSPLLQIEVPELAKANVNLFNLQLSFRNQQGAMPMLEGCWGDNYLFENMGPPFDDGNIVVHGLNASIEQWAQWGFEWLSQQLRSSVVHQRLVNRKGETLSERWLLTDGQVELESRGRRKHKHALRAGSVSQESVIRKQR